MSRLADRDPLYVKPFVDVDEWRDEPVRHRYVHGGFEGTGLRFSFYFPPAELYEGRFFQPLPAHVGDEHGAQSPLSRLSIDFAIDSGAYLVESNLGWTSWRRDNSQSTIHGYRASAAAAEHSRVLAAEMYGEHRPYGYCSGGSGGGFRTISCLENSEAWDGGVPFIHPHPAVNPILLSAEGYAIHVLEHKLPSIVDALEPGGGGDMFAGLSGREREALATLLRLGYPTGALFASAENLHTHTQMWAAAASRMLERDPGYFEDFWLVPGYLGADSPELAAARIQVRAIVKSVVTAKEAPDVGMPMMGNADAMAAPDDPVALLIDGLPDAALEGSTLTVPDGAAAGHVLYVLGRAGELVLAAEELFDKEALRKINPGDEVVIDNSNYLAYQTYHRHQVHPESPEWDQFCVAGEPMYPQREALLGPWFARDVAGSNYSGRFSGKMIVVQNLSDEGAWPSHAVYYRRLVETALGDRLDDRYRLWFTEHAMHGSPVNHSTERPVKTTRVIDYSGVVQQALRDVSLWVEQGKEPPPSTAFEYVDGQVRVPRTADARRGIQPVVSLSANGVTGRVEASVGETVEFTGVADIEPDAGTFVRAEWDFDGAGEFPLVDESIGNSSRHVIVHASHAFTEPGTYFPCLRMTAHRQGDRDTWYALIRNLGRIRVVVS